MALARLRDLGQGLTPDRRANLLHPGVDPAGVVALLESRRDRPLDDAAGQQVGDRALQRLGHLDADVVIVLGDDQQQAVAHAPAP